MAVTYKRCKTPFGYDVDGMIRVIPVGTLVSSNDEAYRKGKEHFEDIETHVAEMAERQGRAQGGRPTQVEPVVEQATAAPGEKRTVVRAPVKQEDPKPEEKK
jgi:hypothetical protein